MSIQPQNSITRPTLPYSHTSQPAPINIPHKSFCGRVWKIIVDYILFPIYSCIMMIFCCQKPKVLPNQSGYPNPPPKPVSKPIEYLPPPQILAMPIEEKDFRLTVGQNLPTNLVQVLKYIACSDEAEQLLHIENENAPEHTPALRVQGHLSAIIEKIRNPNSESPLTTQHLSEFIRMLQARDLGIEYKNTQKPDEIFLKLCLKFNCVQLINSYDPASSYLTQIIYNTNSEPLKQIPREQLYPTLKLFLQSDIFSGLLENGAQEAVLYSNSDDPNKTRLEYLITSGRQIGIQLLQQQFIQLIRTDESELETQIGSLLGKIISILKALNLPPLSLTNPNPIDFLKNTCAALMATDEQFESLYSELIDNAIAPPPFVESENSENNEKNTSQDKSLDEKISNVKEVLLLMREFSAIFQKIAELSQGITERRESRPANNERAMGSALNAFNQSIGCIKREKALIQFKKLLFDEQLDAQSNSKELDELKILIGLMKVNGHNLSTSENVVYSFSRLLSLDTQLTWELRSAIIWKSLEGKLLNTQELAPVDINHISLPLPNLAATCYLNSVLQMMAHLSIFDALLTQAITPPQRFKKDSETPENFETRNAIEKDKLNRELEYRKALQSHLRSIIHRMRTIQLVAQPNQNGRFIPLEKNDLVTLFKLLQINGWHVETNSQEDPHEFLMYLSRVFNISFGCIETTDYVFSNHHSYRSPKTLTLQDISITLPVEHDELLPQFDTMETLINHNFAAETIDYTPPGETAALEYTKQTFVTSDPQTLFVHLKRFENMQERICAKVPISPRIKLSVYDKADLSAPPRLVSYQLRVVICHHPLQYKDPSSNETVISRTLQGGHYTSQILQSYNHADAWIHYNDSCISAASIKNPGEYPPGVVNNLNANGYYIAYERIDNEPNEKLEQPLQPLMNEDLL